jgi:spore coat protein CotH
MRSKGILETRRWRLAYLPCALIALMSAGPSAVFAPTSDELFDSRTLHEVRLLISARDLEELRHRYHENTHYTADLIWRGIRVRNVGLRSRGAGSRNPFKLGLEIDFNHYVADQQFLGLKALVLDNLWQDPAMIRERTAMAFFARMGYPAPREAFCRLYINDVYQGVYAVVEPIDTAFLARTLGEASGYLFEYRWRREFHGEYLGGDLLPYTWLFDAKTHEREPAIMLHAPIHDTFREVNAEDAPWRERVESYLDLQQFVTHVALETFIAEVDGILGYAGMNNFYLYRGASSNRHRLFPWDKDIAFNQLDASILLRTDENVIFRRALTHADLQGVYFDVLEQCARSAMQDGWLANEIDLTASLIAAAVYEDPLKPFSNDEFDAGVAFMKEFARRRPTIVLQEAAAARVRR